LAIVLATVYARFFEQTGPTVNLIWVANGLLLTYLLLAPRWRWPAYLIAGTAAMVVGSKLIGEPWKTNLLYNVLNLIEVMVGALLLRRKSTQLPHFTDRKYLVRFVGYAVLAGPIASGAILTLLMGIRGHTTPLKTLFDWVVGDGLGVAVMVPTFVAIFESRFPNSAGLKQHWQYPFVLAAVSVAAFSQNRMPLLILIVPVLVLILMRLGLGWAALATLFVAASASWYSLHGQGPFAISGKVHLVEASIQLQFFVACCIFTIYVVSVILEDRNATEYRLQEIASVHSLVTDNSRDVILLTDLEGRRTYVSPAVEGVNDWKPEELLGRKLSEQAHPEDRERVDAAVQRLRGGSEGIILEYRVQKRNGDYVWVESSLRMFRDRRTRVPAGILSLVRDISERKRSEDLLLQAYQALEELAVLDPLTGVANRRRFDECLANEWSRATRLQKPVSLLLIDADSFKQHNDSYGHLSGDRCLKRIAQAAIEAAKRPEDLVARFGGDEFAVILPNTDEQGAQEVGGKIRAILNRRASDRKENPEGSFTISVGCGTVVPKMGDHPEDLIHIADQALYKAKRNGRDQLCMSFVPLPSLTPDA
jgi:diguanylate cyclase (GGDEF)-like protein/PAS domain S-box-containing protein